MKQYHDYLKYILENGTKKEDRTGTGTTSIFGYQMRFDLSKGFPLVTTKKLHFKSIAIELLWFLRGDTNTKFLNDNGVSIWDKWADENGNLGKIYGYQWTNWKTKFGFSCNQITELINNIKEKPDSRRHIVTAWNPAYLPDENFTPQENVKEGLMALAPCHAFFQFYTQELSLEERMNIYFNLHPTWCIEDFEHSFFDKHNIPKRKLSCMLTMRSADSFLGVPYNIASYALLTEMIAQQCDLVPGELIWSGGDCHIYNNHIEQVKLQLEREPYELPRLNFKRKPESIFGYKYEDFEIVDYKTHPHIKGDVAI